MLRLLWELDITATTQDLVNQVSMMTRMELRREIRIEIGRCAECVEVRKEDGARCKVMVDQMSTKVPDESRPRHALRKDGH